MSSRLHRPRSGNPGMPYLECRLVALHHPVPGLDDKPAYRRPGIDSHASLEPLARALGIAYGLPPGAEPVPHSRADRPAGRLLEFRLFKAAAPVTVSTLVDALRAQSWLPATAHLLLLAGAAIRPSQAGCDIIAPASRYLPAPGGGPTPLQQRFPCLRAAPSDSWRLEFSTLTQDQAKISKAYLFARSCGQGMP